MAKIEKHDLFIELTLKGYEIGFMLDYLLAKNVPNANQLINFPSVTLHIHGIQEHELIAECLSRDLTIERKKQ